MPTVTVRIPSAHYDVIVRPGLLDETGKILSGMSQTKKAVVITDSNVGPIHATRLMESLRRASIEPILVTLRAGEQYKNLQSLLPVFDQLLAARIERSTPVLALGGGVVGDMAGFVAATALRGIPFVQIPTSLLAMVDASVGGKTGVDHPAGKNLIGAFHQPIAVLADPEVLRTLPIQRVREGLAECIKHDIIRDAAGFADLEKNVARALRLDMQYLTELVTHNVAIKAAVVAADPFEKGERAHLNLGHTFGHAIESVTNYATSHGQAVSLGITAASFMATKLGLLNEPDRQRIVAVLRSAGLSTDGLSADPNAVFDAMFSDKKVESAKLRFIFPDGIGKATIRNDVPDALVREAIKGLK